MRTVTRYIVVLCPAAPWYLGNANSVTMMLSDARVFDTFEDAQAEGNLRRAWHAQRVEQIAVPDTRQHLDTPEARLEVRDAATCAWHECADGDPVTVRIRHVEQYLRSIGLTVGVSANPGASSPVLFLLTDPNGYALTLAWDSMQDGFSYETEGEDAFEVTYCMPDGVSPKAKRAISKWGREACRKAWACNRHRGEGLTVCSIESGIPVRSVNSAINAWQEVQDAAAPETATCDGCENAFPVDEVEVCGSAEHGPFGFCSACRAKDAAAAVSEPTDHVGKGALDGLDLEQMRSVVHYLLGYSGLTLFREKDSRTGEERVMAYHDCDGSMSVLAVKPRIDMVPAKTHTVRIEGEYDAICDMLGEAVGCTIDAYEITERGGAKG